LLLQQFQMFLSPRVIAGKTEQLEQKRAALVIRRVIPQAGTQSVYSFLELACAKEL